MCLAIPGKIIKIDGFEFDRIGVISFGGLSKEISLCLVPDAKIGDFVLVHAGFAINIIDQSEALKTLSHFEQQTEFE